MSEAAAPPLCISTECPLCGAPLELREATNAVRCAHCSSDLLVTGRRQVLSYAIQPLIDGREASGLARITIPAREPTTRVGDPSLFWVPYYRVTGEVLCWRSVDDRTERLARLRETARELRMEPEVLLAAASLDAARDQQVESYRVAHTMLAAPDAPASASLGVRAEALVLGLFDEEKARTIGTVLPPRLPSHVARRQLLVPRSPETVVHHEVLHASLSVVYFPIWTIEIAGARAPRRLALDGITGAAIQGASAGHPLATLHEERVGGRSTRTIGLRPLVCPNCAGALPLRPDDVVFRCASCARTWLAEAQHLLEVPQCVVAAPHGTAVARHLPVWEIADSSGQVAYAPAFRCRRLRALTDLASRLTSRQPTLAAAEDQPAELVGCGLDRRDALALVRFAKASPQTTAGGRGGRINQEPSPAPGQAEVSARNLHRPRWRLLWLPFAHDGYAYAEAYTGASFPTRLLDLAA